AITTGVFLALRIVLGIVRARLVARATRTGRTTDVYLARLLERTWTLTVLAASALLVLSFHQLEPAVMAGRRDIRETIRTLALLAISVRAGRWGTRLIDTALEQGFRLARFSESAARTAFDVVRFFALAVLWTSVMILVLSAFGVEVTPFLAGLGVGGVAVGFA